MATETRTNVVTGQFIDELLDERAAAKFLDLKPGTLSVWRCTGRYRIPFIKVGCRVRYRRSALEAWLDSRVRDNDAAA